MQTFRMASLSLCIVACSSNNGGNGSTGGAFGNGSTGGALGNGSTGGAFGNGSTGGAFGNGSTGGAFGNGSTGGALDNGSTGGAFNNGSTGGSTEPPSETGGVANTSGGASGSGGGTASTGGNAATGTGGAQNAPQPCGAGAWPAADPAKTGPLAVTTEANVGPSSGYTLVRPTDLTSGCAVHPLVTWGNGTGTTPSVYSFLLNRLASHGFVVIASNSQNVAQGTPPPMLDGVTWALQQNGDASSELHGHIDAAHIGATGHSQGALATMSAGADARITTVAPIEGFFAGTLHGPALMLCGGQDLHSPGIGCDALNTAYAALTVPEMGAELLVADHTNWISASITAGISGQPMSGFVTAVTGWMRVQLMGDANLRSMFYGPECTMCKDTADWVVEQKNLN